MDEEVLKRKVSEAIDKAEFQPPVEPGSDERYEFRLILGESWTGWNEPIQS